MQHPTWQQKGDFSLEPKYREVFENHILRFSSISHFLYVLYRYPNEPSNAAWSYALLPGIFSHVKDTYGGLPRQTVKIPALNTPSFPFLGSGGLQSFLRALPHIWEVGTCEPSNLPDKGTTLKPEFLNSNRQCFVPDHNLLRNNTNVQLLTPRYW